MPKFDGVTSYEAVEHMPTLSKDLVPPLCLLSCSVTRYNTQSCWCTASLFLTVSLLTNSSFLCLHYFVSKLAVQNKLAVHHRVIGCCILLPRTTVTVAVPWSVGLSVTTVNPAKADELIVMPSGVLTRVDPGNHILDGVQIPHAKGQYFRAKMCGPL